MFDIVCYYLKMDKDLLIKKRSEVERRFNALQEQKNNTVEEMVKLQGEYRSLDELINEFPDKKAKKVSPKADVINASAAVEESPDGK